MAADLAGTPRSGLNVQLCGDAHLMNFGVFGSPERRLVFDINDFDETLPGPWEWDVKRLAASFAIAGRDNGFTTKDRRKVAAGRGRRVPDGDGRVRRHDEPGGLVHALDVDRLRSNESGKLATAKARKRAEANVAKARTRDSLQAFDKLTHVVDGERRIISDPPLIEPIEDLFVGMEPTSSIGRSTRLIAQLPPDTADRSPSPARGVPVVDIARKVVGVGSVGTRAWIILLLGRDDSDPLFLQAKEAQPSVLE